jgi:adenylyltransferase/sulfurtransferase
MLTEQQIERYSRQIILPELGGRGQQTLLSAAVAIVGGGALGTAAATYVAAAGVGRLTIAAPELQLDIEALNPDCQMTTLLAPLTDASAQDIARHADAVLVCGAMPTVCTLLNAACVAHRTPLVWADIVGARGLITVLVGRRLESPCYTCVAPNLSRWLSGGDAAQVLAEATAALIGTLQATETIKVLVGLGAAPAARLLTYDAAAGTVGEMAADKDPRCQTCGAHPT